jgi:methyl-accepting chemotaxis protein/methyl-accepting chemotaxis protein-1 (serine sensor receptor)
MKSTMTIGKKLTLTVGGLLAAMAVVGCVSIYNLARSNQTTQVIVTDSLTGMGSVAEARATILLIRGDIWRHVASSDASTKAQLEREIEDGKGDVAQSLHAYEGTINTPEDRVLFDKVKEAWQRYSAAYGPALELSRAGKSAEAEAQVVREVVPLSNALRDALSAQFSFNKKRGEEMAAESQQGYHRTLWILWCTLGLSLLGGAGFAFMVIRSTNNTLMQLADELSEGAQQTASAASQVSSLSQSLAQGSSEQAASLEETSASSEEINSMAVKNTENSRGAAELVSQSQQKFVETNQSLEHMVVAMDQIKTSSDRISKIIKTIDEIAFQTNILALNAAVEAARAGEAGMGFAVVADEVRNLAQRSAQAAKDTAALIEESISKSGDGKIKVDQVAVAIRAITEQAGNIKVLVDDVNMGSQEQARGIDQIGKALTQMEHVTQKTAANAEECASAAEELNAQSVTLKGIVERLTALVGGDSGHTSNTRARQKRTPRLAATQKNHRDSAEGLVALRSKLSRKPLDEHGDDFFPAAAKAAKNASAPVHEFEEF